MRRFTYGLPPIILALRQDEKMITDLGNSFDVAPGQWILVPTPASKGESSYLHFVDPYPDISSFL